ncbi:MAG: hypothetical protein HOE90_17185 [Bacteriovoracaceae bacterium]|jgi:hypothetical protein|nr:hypothetical protein [Bacteriovoracaceae bacterium]
MKKIVLSLIVLLSVSISAEEVIDYPSYTNSDSSGMIATTVVIRTMSSDIKMTYTSAQRAKAIYSSKEECIKMAAEASSSYLGFKRVTCQNFYTPKNTDEYNAKWYLEAN